ncbi:hypothetical protein FA95DRAFT_545425 [Auriscalpium vulgare]|uniref:Uncharacterized protein n=1 Tax=Auriscalpium vulgare TaxID=40419 RepID=A0ACB8RG71_9AGAM|nr:hypothetical protein FA95DRAFT_545425 [Auriscalpium vulgare]
MLMIEPVFLQLFSYATFLVAPSSTIATVAAREMKTSCSKPSGFRLPSTRKRKGLRVRIATGAMARTPCRPHSFDEVAPRNNGAHGSLSPRQWAENSGAVCCEGRNHGLPGLAAGPSDPYGPLRDGTKSPVCASTPANIGPFTMRLH